LRDNRDSHGTGFPTGTTRQVWRDRPGRGLSRGAGDALVGIGMPPDRGSDRAMSRPRLRAAWTLAAVLTMTPGCSWVFVARAPDLPTAPDVPAGCTRSALLPALDVAGGAVGGLLGILLFAMAVTTPVAADCPANDSSCLTPTDRTGLIAASAGTLALGALAAFSAAYGFSETERCREIAGWQAGCLSGFEDDCWKLAGPRAVLPLPELPTHLRPQEQPPVKETSPEVGPPATTAPSPAPSPPRPEPPTPPPPPPKSPFGPPTRPRAGLAPGRAGGIGLGSCRAGGPGAGGRGRSR